jgi:aspartate racemase
VKTIGLIGGLSWESSLLYYRLINEAARDCLGGLHSAECVLYSFDFHAIEALQQADRWDEAAARLIDAAQRLERAGAGLIVICSNTMHRMADEVQAAIGIPLLHIADATAERIRAAGLRRIGLLGTRYTMEQDFYKGRLVDRFGLDVLVPDAAGREVVHRVIYDELVRGVINSASKAAYVEVMLDLAARGAEGIILGCTEITLLVGPEDTSVPVFDTTAIHAVAALESALADEANILN